MAMAAPQTATVNIGTSFPAWAVLPFGGILLSIALCPMWTPNFWHDHSGKVAAFWALLFVVPFVSVYRFVALHEIAHTILLDYVPFIVLLWALFTISGGIVITGSLRDTPAANTLLLLIGTFLASWVGTTGASMVMIRPVLRANQNRLRKAHVICFFIFLVANVGGALSPLGDPPLLLGFLHNVPFFWVTAHVLPHFLFTTALLLSIFYCLDGYIYRREKVQRENKGGKKVPIRIEGLHNLALLAGVVGIVLLSSHWKPGTFSIMGIDIGYQMIVQNALIVILGSISLGMTKKQLREANNFSWQPIKEVAQTLCRDIHHDHPRPCDPESGKRVCFLGAYLRRKISWPLLLGIGDIVPVS